MSTFSSMDSPFGINECIDVAINIVGYNDAEAVRLSLSNDQRSSFLSIEETKELIARLSAALFCIDDETARWNAILAASKAT